MRSAANETGDNDAGECVAPAWNTTNLEKFRQAMLHGLRFTCLAGDESDHHAATVGLTEILALPSIPGPVADLSHLVLALLTLTRSSPAELRVGPVPATGQTLKLAELAARKPTQDDIETARQHLDAASGSADNPALADITALVKALVAVADAEHLTEEERRLATGYLDDAIAHSPGEPVLHRMLETMQAALYSKGAVESGDPRQKERAIDMLVDAADRLGADHLMRPAVFDLIGALARRPDDAPDTPEQLDDEIVLLERALSHIPDDHPARTQTLTSLFVSLIHGFGLPRNQDALHRMRRLLEKATRRPAADKTNDGINHLLLAHVITIIALAENNIDQLDAADELVQKEAVTATPNTGPIRLLLPQLRAMILMTRFLLGGGLENLTAAQRYQSEMRNLEHEAAAHPGAEPHFAQLSSMVDVMSALASNFRRDELDGMPDQLAEILRRLPAGTQQANQISSFQGLMTTAVSALHSGLMTNSAPSAQSIAQWRAGVDQAMAAAAATPEHAMDYADTLATTGMSALGLAFATNDRPLLERGLGMLKQASTKSAVFSGQQAKILGCLGIGLVMRHSFTRDRRDIDNAIDRLTAARRLLRDLPGNTSIGEAVHMLGWCHRIRADPALGDLRRASDLGVEGLIERAGDVLLQGNARDALDLAVSARDEVAEVARWCLDAGQPTLAVQALELGRAMVLHATAVDANVPELLRATGHPDLAAAWERDGTAAITNGSVSGLRHRVMRAIEGTAAERRLLSPPSAADIAGALRNTDSDALVYLIPRYERSTARAVIVRADGQIDELPLPMLAERVPQLENFELARRDLDGGDPSVLARFRSAIDELCGWAWPTMERVLAATEKPGAHHKSRLILIPVGAFGAVPWHAAYRPVLRNRRRYAGQDAIVSYAASARQLIDASRRGHAPWDSAPALIRVFGSDLWWTRVELTQLQAHCYPQANCPGGRGIELSAEDVLRLLPGPDSSGASVVHVCCHGYVSRLPVDSYLQVGTATRITVREILEHARGRPADGPGGLVVLAACASDLTDATHDEALTLATAFLAAGAVGVVGTRWPVDDRITALAMTMFHHYLNAGYAEPAAALRAAQLWMLDPDRRLPAGIGGVLADEASDPELADITSWAGFTYQGR